jgi:hypothetical protein
MIRNKKKKRRFPDAVSSANEQININVPAQIDPNAASESEGLSNNNTNPIKKTRFALDDEVLSPCEAVRFERDAGPRNLFNPDGSSFYIGEDKPALFDVDVDRELYDHLLHDDLDEVSKNEVAYRIMKQ